MASDENKLIISVCRARNLNRSLIYIRPMDTVVGLQYVTLKLSDPTLTATPVMRFK